MVSEQFIQDAFCRPDRIAAVLRQLGHQGWQFLPDGPNGDVVNQEVSFDMGRIDILATFNGRQKLVVIEVKAGAAGPEAVDQLTGYLGNRETMELAALKLNAFTPGNVVGIVLAEGFVGIKELPPNVALLEFKFQERSWPFRLVPLSEVKPLPAADELPNRAAKASGLYRLADHRDYMHAPELRAAFERIANCFIDPVDSRFQWVVSNVKGGHVAVHYKGEYLAHLWAKRNFFQVGYDVGRNRRWQKVQPEGLDSTMEEIELDFVQMLAVVDKQLPPVIPAGFDWFTAISSISSGTNPHHD